MFGIGFFVGILFLNLGRTILMEETCLFDRETLTNLKYMVLDEELLFFYVLRKRLWFLVLFTLLATTYLGRIACKLVITWFGFALGMMLAALSLRFGLKGQVLAVVWMFPHFLVYVPVTWLFLLWCENLNNVIYRKRTIAVGELRFVLFRGIQFLLFAAAMTFGCMLEGYVGSRVLIGYLKIF